MKIDRENLKQFREEFSKAVEKIEKKFKLKIEQGSISFNMNEFSMKIKCISEDKQAKERMAVNEKMNFELMAESLGGDKKWFGKSFTDKGKTFTIVGVKPRKRKFPFVVKDNDGKQYGATASWIKANMYNKINEKLTKALNKAIGM